MKVSHAKIKYIIYSVRYEMFRMYNLLFNWNNILWASVGIFYPSLVTLRYFMLSPFSIRFSQPFDAEIVSFGSG